MLRASSVHTPTALCISAPVHLTSSGKVEVLRNPLLQGLLEMSRGYCHKCSGTFRPEPSAFSLTTVSSSFLVLPTSLGSHPPISVLLSFFQTE